MCNRSEDGYSVVVGKMGLKLSFTLSFALFFSLALSSSSSSSLLSNSSFDSKLLLPFAPELFSPQSEFAASILALLGTSEDAKTVPAAVARQIESCLKFLVPFSRSHWNFQENIPLRRGLLRIGDPTGDDKKVHEPPTSVLELARLAMDSGGNPSAIQNALDPKSFPVPDVEGAAKDKCGLTEPTAKRFQTEESNDYFAFLHELITERANPSVVLSRYDLFHGHMFIAKNRRLGMLFHAKEYPAESAQFPIPMGNCQKGSNVRYNERSMNVRNILWLAPLPSKTSKDWVAPGVLVALDARPDGIINKKLVSADTAAQRLAKTIDQDYFGVHAVDVNYLNVPHAVLGQKIFIV